MSSLCYLLFGLIGVSISLRYCIYCDRKIYPIISRPFGVRSEGNVAGIGARNDRGCAVRSCRRREGRAVLMSNARRWSEVNVAPALRREGRGGLGGSRSWMICKEGEGQSRGFRHESVGRGQRATQFGRKTFVADRGNTGDGIVEAARGRVVVDDCCRKCPATK